MPKPVIVHLIDVDNYPDPQDWPPPRQDQGFVFFMNLGHAKAISQGAVLAIASYRNAEIILCDTYSESADLAILGWQSPGSLSLPPNCKVRLNPVTKDKGIHVALNARFIPGDRDWRMQVNGTGMVRVGGSSAPGGSCTLDALVGPAVARAWRAQKANEPWWQRFARLADAHPAIRMCLPLGLGWTGVAGDVWCLARTLSSATATTAPAPREVWHVPTPPGLGVVDVVPIRAVPGLLQVGDASKPTGQGKQDWVPLRRLCADAANALIRSARPLHASSANDVEDRLDGIPFHATRPGDLKASVTLERRHFCARSPEGGYVKADWNSGLVSKGLQHGAQPTVRDPLWSLFDLMAWLRYFRMGTPDGEQKEHIGRSVQGLLDQAGYRIKGVFLAPDVSLIPVRRDSRWCWIPALVGDGDQVTLDSGQSVRVLTFGPAHRASRVVLTLVRRAVRSQGQEGQAPNQGAPPPFVVGVAVDPATQQFILQRVHPKTGKSTVDLRLRVRDLIHPLIYEVVVPGTPKQKAGLP